MANISQSGAGYQMVSPSPPFFPLLVNLPPLNLPVVRPSWIREQPEPVRPDRSAAKQTNPLNCKEGHFSQPVLTRLSLHWDRIRVWADLPTTKAAPHPLLLAGEKERLSFGAFTLTPLGYGRGLLGRLYDVYHRNHSDPVITLESHPTKGRRNRFWFNVANRLNYTGDAVKIGLEFLEALGLPDGNLSHLEAAGDSPDWLDVAKFISANETTISRKNGDYWNKKISKGEVTGMRIGKTSSARFGNMYRNGNTLNRRNRQYIADKAVDAGVIAPNDGLKLVRFEWNLKPKEVKRLEYKDAPVTLKTLLDPLALFEIYKSQMDSGFTFRQKATGKDVPFFDWEAIKANYLEQYNLSDDGAATLKRKSRTARKSSATYGAKQAIKKLTNDSRKGDYLVKSLRPKLERAAKVTFLNDQRLKALTDTISGAGCDVDGELLRQMITAYVSEAAKGFADQLATSLPLTIASTIAREHNVESYLRKQLSELRTLPDVVRLDNTFGHEIPAL